MLQIKHRFARLGLTLAVAGLMTASVAVPALAADTITQSVLAGSRTASIADLTLDAVTYSHSDQPSTGTMSLTADDSTGSDAGWNVTVQASAFAAGANTIAASNFSIGTLATPAANAGQAVDPTNGPLAGEGGSLDAARKVIFAEAGFGKGNYSQDLPVTLTIPGQTLAGEYVSTLTVTISAGPGL